LPMTIKPAAVELASLRMLNDFVVAKTAIPEIGNNGRYNWMVARVAGDLKTYVSQAAHPALCTGAPQMLDFYQGEFQPLVKRIGDIGDLSRTVRGQVAARLEDLAKLTPGAEVLGVDTGYAGLILALSRQVVPADKSGAVANATDGLKRLEMAKAALLDVANAATSEPAGEQPAPQQEPVVEPAVRDAIYAALRMIEAGLYADVFVEKYRVLEASILGTSRSIRGAHTKTCTCAD
jgi:hypothetical protein